MRFDNRAKLAFVIACVTLLAGSAVFQYAVGALNIYLKKEPVELRPGMTLSSISSTLGRWQQLGEDHIFDEAMIESLGTSKYVDRHYALDGNPSLGPVSVHLAYYTGLIDTVPHVPERCFVAAGLNQKSEARTLALKLDRSRWQNDPTFVNIATGQPYPLLRYQDDFTRQWREARMPVGELALRTFEFEDPKRPRQRIFAGYFFIANGRVTPSNEGVRRLAFDLSQRYAYYCKVQFTWGDPNATDEKFVELVSELLNHLLPELMQRLPDWSEVERRGSPQVSGGPAMNG